MESPAKMEKRLSDPSGSSRQSSSRKCKRRPGRKDVLPDTCPDSRHNGGGDSVSGMEYPPGMLWQSSVPQVNGQRLFAAMSDPSMCGYSPMPVPMQPYTMQPFSLPPMYNVYQPVPFPNVRSMHGRTRRDRNVRERTSNVCHNAKSNACADERAGDDRQQSRLDPSIRVVHQNGDYASLPPTADGGINGDELNSEHRRYSDPGLGPAKTSDSEESVESGSSITTIGRSNKLILSLIEQITDLKKYNSQLFKELNVTKSYLESMTTKLAQCKHCTSSDYQPGALSDLIREIREANKKCEEGLVTKVKIMLEERHSQQMKEIEEFKNQLSIVVKEKEESEKRVTKLEEELTTLKLNITNAGREIAAFEEETLALRRELQEARASRTLAENHAAKLEKLVEILRKKVNGTTAVNRIRDFLTAGACAVPASPAKELTKSRAPPSSSSSSSSSSSEDERDDEAANENDNENGDDDDADGGSVENASKNDKDSSSDPKTPSTIDSNINLSGPVTDL